MSTSANPKPSDTQEPHAASELQIQKVRKARLICVNPDALASGCEHVVIPVLTTPITIGRGVSNDVVLTASGVSRDHIRLVFANGHWMVEDAGSSNGVEINKTTVETQRLNEGDIISLGTVHYKFSLESGNGALVADAEQQVSLFDAEKTLVVTREELDLDSSPKPEPRTPAMRKTHKGSSGWLVAGFVVLVVFALFALRV